VGDAVGVGGTGVGVRVRVGDAVGVGVGDAVGVGVLVAVGVSVAVGVGVLVTVGVSVAVDVGVIVAVGVSGSMMTMGVGVAVTKSGGSVSAGVAVGVAVAKSGGSVSAGVAVGVAVAMGRSGGSVIAARAASTMPVLLLVGVGVAPCAMPSASPIASAISATALRYTMAVRSLPYTGAPAPCSRLQASDANELTRWATTTYPHITLSLRGRDAVKTGVKRRLRHERRRLAEPVTIVKMAAVCGLRSQVLVVYRTDDDRGILYTCTAEYMHGG
jgi:hypothetical protein